MIVPFNSIQFLICRLRLLHDLSVGVGSIASPARNFEGFVSGCLSPFAG